MRSKISVLSVDAVGSDILGELVTTPKLAGGVISRYQAGVYRKPGLRGLCSW